MAHRLIGGLDGLNKMIAHFFCQGGGHFHIHPAFFAMEQLFDLFGFVGLLDGDGVVDLLKRFAEGIDLEVLRKIDAFG